MNDSDIPHQCRCEVCKSEMTLGDLLVRHGLVDPAAVEDPEGYDRGVTATRIQDLQGALQKSAPSGIEAIICEDITARQKRGIRKYGTTVVGNPPPIRSWLQHAYEEHLDAVVYLRRAICELELNGK